MLLCFGIFVTKGLGVREEEGKAQTCIHILSKNRFYIADFPTFVIFADEKIGFGLVMMIKLHTEVSSFPCSPKCVVLCCKGKYGGLSPQANTEKVQTGCANHRDRAFCGSSSF
jgi:hypothetical protein